MKNDQGSAISGLDLTVVATDTKLARILGGDDRACAVELWVLQLQAQGSIESRLLYGRVSPYDFSNARWSSPAEDHFKAVRDGLSAQCARLTVYCPSNNLLSFLGAITAGATLADASKSADISMSSNFESRFGTLNLQLPLAVRPSMHLPTRDYFRWSTNKLSPLDSCSCDSASISSLVKSELFLAGREEDRELASFAIDLLSADTGLEFADLDAWRLGDVELLVLPGLTEQGGALVHLHTVSGGMSVQIEQPLASGANSFRVHARLLNDGAVFHSTSTFIAPGATYPVTVNLNWPPALEEIRDAFAFEIEAQDSKTGVNWLCYQWGAFLVREIGQTMNFTGGQALFKSDWLSKALRPSHMSRLEEAQQITRHTRGTESVIGGRKADPWVTANRHVTSTVKSLVPPRSKGRFFLRYSEGENTGRLELAEWIKRLLADHRDKHIAWFDPYMEDMGIHLLNAYGSDSGTYTVFTGTGRGESTPWWEHMYAWVKGDAPPEDRPDRRVENLLAACKVWVARYGTVRLRVFGLPQEDLHDRMVLVRDAQMRPVVGYHLSNSLQKANENHPLLITPIPADVLQRVLDYSDELLRCSASLVGGQSGGVVKLKSLFDSEAQEKDPQRYIPIDVFGTARAGELLDWWLSSSDLAGADAPTLKGQLNARGLLLDGQLRDDVFEQLPAKIWQQGVQLSSFNSAWDALGTILSSTMAGDTIYEAPDSSVPSLRDALLNYLDSDRSDAIQPPERRTMVDMTTELRRSLADLMKQAAEPQQSFCHDVTEVSWGDYYALKVLWATDPASLVTWVEDGADDRFRANRRRQLGLKCAARLISFEVERSCSPRQLESLLKSANGLLRWIGYVAFESIAHDDPKALAPSGTTSLLAPDERLDLLGWMTARAVHWNVPIRQALIQELHDSMPAKLDDVALKRSVDSMRNVVGRVYDTPPWMLGEVLLPLVNTQRLGVDVVARLWFDELFNAWTKRDTSSIIFRTDTEGHFTDEVARLCAAASVDVRKAILVKVSKEVAAHARVVQRPFSAQIDWSSYNQAFGLLLWISSFMWAWLGQSPRPSQIEQGLMLVDAALARRNQGEWGRSSFARLLRYRESHVPTAP
ncbi:MAG: VPA1262 family protein [Pseudomonadota bacterium]